MLRKGLLIISLLVSSAIPGVTCSNLGADKPGRCGDSACIDFCTRSPVVVGFNRPMPGFFTQQKDGKLIVAGVVLNSPAYFAGVQIGDELLVVDDAPVPFSGDGPIWGNGRVHTARFKRGSQRLAITIETVPVQDLLAHLPTRHQILQQVSYRSGDPDFSAAPFMSGMMLHREGIYLVVDRVIHKSPADVAGLEPGDRLAFSRTQSVASLEYSNERKTLAIDVLRRFQRKTVRLRFASLSELLESASLK